MMLRFVLRGQSHSPTHFRSRRGINMMVMQRKPTDYQEMLRISEIENKYSFLGTLVPLCILIYPSLFVLVGL